MWRGSTGVKWCDVALTLATTLAPVRNLLPSWGVSLSVATSFHTTSVGGTVSRYICVSLWWLTWQLLCVVRRDKEVLHVKVYNTGDYFDVFNGHENTQFTSLYELLSYYWKPKPTQSPLKESSGKPIQLLAPVLNDYEPNINDRYAGQNCVYGNVECNLTRFSLCSRCEPLLLFFYLFYVMLRSFLLSFITVFSVLLLLLL